MGFLSLIIKRHSRLRRCDVFWLPWPETDEAQQMTRSYQIRMPCALLWAWLLGFAVWPLASAVAEIWKRNLYHVDRNGLVANGCHLDIVLVAMGVYFYSCLFPLKAFFLCIIYRPRRKTIIGRKMLRNWKAEKTNKNLSWRCRGEWIVHFGFYCNFDIICVNWLFACVIWKRSCIFQNCCNISFHFFM